MKRALFVISMVLIGVILSLAPLVYIARMVVDSPDSDIVEATKIHLFVLGNCEPADDGIIDFLQHPLHTLIRGKGDCEDLAFLEWVLFRISGLDASLVYGTLKVSFADGTSDSGKHIWVEYQGEIWETRYMRPLGPDPRCYDPIFRIP